MKNRDPKVKTEIERFNKQFYGSFDVDYFLQKCFYLVALLSKPEEVSNILKQGVGFKSLKMQLSEDDDTEMLKTEKLQRNLKAEIATTYFHAIETLFRIIFAHARTTDCPWVELTINNNFKKFKKDVEKFTKHEYFKVDHMQGLTLIFYGRVDKPDGVTKAVWGKSLKNISDFLDNFGSDLQQSYAYNSYKHGLAMFSEEFGFSLGSIIKVDKEDALVFLSFDDDKEQPDYKQLHRNYVFTKWEQKWALVYQLTHMLDNVMKIGNWQYNKGDYSVKLFDKLDLLSVIKSGDNPIQPSTVSESSFSFKMGRSK
jgi:hypothetical protein